MDEAPLLLLPVCSQPILYVRRSKELRGDPSFDKRTPCFLLVFSNFSAFLLLFYLTWYIVD